jgi:hypothetical protein
MKSCLESDSCVAGQEFPYPPPLMEVTPIESRCWAQSSLRAHELFLKHGYLRSWT